MTPSQHGSNKQQLISQIKTNQQMVAVFDAEAFEQEWAEGNIVRTAQLKTPTTPFQRRDDTKTGIGHATDALSIMKFTKMAADMGMSGQVILKTYDNKPYVIFKSTGNLHHFVSQLKQRLGKSKQITIKPKIVRLAIGNGQALNGAVRGGMITFAIFTAVNIMDYIIRDQATFARLAGTIASDFAKISVAALAGVAAHAIGSAGLSVYGVSHVAALTLGPIIVAIAAGFLIGFLLNTIDDKYKLTDKIVTKLAHFFKNADQISYDIKEELNYIEKNPIQAFSRIFGTPVLPF